MTDPAPGDQPALALMVKRPQAGRTKTRLCPPLTFSQAAGLYEAFLLDSIQNAVSVPNVQLALAITPADEASLVYFRSIAPPGTLLLPVEGATIGHCLDRVLHELLDRGFSRVAAMSTDSPTIRPEQIALAFERLLVADLVLCPGDDGGYYWVGVRARHPRLFDEDIPWSTAEVAAATYRRARELGLRVDLAPPILDIDTVEDLARLEVELARFPANTAVFTRRFLAQNPFPGGAPLEK